LLTDLLAVFIGDVKERVIQSMRDHDRVATGQTIDSFTTVVTPLGATIYAPQYVVALEKGRGPYKGGGQGSVAMIDSIKQWCIARGIDEKFAYAIKKKIDAEGYKGRAGVLTDVLSEDHISEPLNALTASITQSLTSLIFIENE
jgi:hypothetical protein